MRFTLIDRIVEREPGKQIRCVKNLTLAEEYLADHFPTFPVLPGVLMLQAMVETASWLWRLDTDYQHSVIVLREARNVKYGNFVQPGKSLEVIVERVKHSDIEAVFKGRGEVEGQQAVSGQFTLAGYNLRDRDPTRQDWDEDLIRHWKRRGAWLMGNR